MEPSCASASRLPVAAESNSSLLHPDVLRAVPEICGARDPPVMHGVSQLSECDVLQLAVTSKGRRVGGKVGYPIAPVTPAQNVALQICQLQSALFKLNIRRYVACHQGANQHLAGAESSYGMHRSQIRAESRIDPSRTEPMRGCTDEDWADKG